MTDYLAYWQKYWDDHPNLRPLDFDWYTDDERFHRQVRPGDTIWVVVTGGPTHPREWRLLQRVVVLKPDPHEVQSPYRRLHVFADVPRSEAYDLATQQDLTTVLKRLEFRTRKPIRVDAGKIGQTLQRPRALSSDDSGVLRSYAEGLA
jgi:hypothetical protein